MRLQPYLENQCQGRDEPGCARIAIAARAPKIIVATTLVAMVCACSGGGGESPLDAGGDGSILPGDGGIPELQVDYAGHLAFDRVCSADSWCWDNPLPSGHDLQDVWGSGPDDVWIAGRYALYHWNGSTLSYTAVDEWLHGLWGFSSDDVWAVGQSVYRWDGSSWSPPAGGVPFQTYYSAWGAASDDVWMVGDTGAIAHWDGSSISEVDSGTDFDLVSVAGSSASDIWIAGSEWALCRDQAGWMEHPFPAIFWSSLWVDSPTHAWAVGVGGIMAKWDGLTWSDLPSFSGNGLTDVQGLGRDDVWVSGTRGTLANWDGFQWASVALPYERLLRGLWAEAPGHVWSVGDSGAIVRLKDGELYDTPVVSESDLYDIHGVGDSDLWAVGGDYLDGTSTLHFDGTTWSKIDNNLGEWLNAVFAISSNDVWAVGQNGIIAHWDGTTWSEVPSGTTTYLYDVWASGPDDVWAVGQDTTILHFDGQSWTPSAAPTGFSTLTAIFGFGSDDIWIVGSGGHTLHRQNGAWIEVPSGTSQYLSAIWGAASDDVWAFSTRYAYRWDGVSWTEFTSQLGEGGTTGQAWGTGPDNIYVDLGADKIGHWNGVEWTIQELFKDSNTRSLYASGDRVWAVGYHGAILSRGP